MVVILFVLLSLVLLGVYGVLGVVGIVFIFVENIGLKIFFICFLNDSFIEVIGYCWLKGGVVLKEDILFGQKMDFEVDFDDFWGEYFCVFFFEFMGRVDIQFDGIFRVKVVKLLEYVSEGEMVVLVCKLEFLFFVIDWVWYKIIDFGDQVIVNGFQGRFFVSFLQGWLELYIENLNMEVDFGKYVCNGISFKGIDQVVIIFCVCSYLVVFWFFLGIVVEVLVLVIIIFIYEKCWKFEDVLDDDDVGFVFLKSSGQYLNDKGKKV